MIFMQIHIDFFSGIPANNKFIHTYVYAYAYLCMHAYMHTYISTSPHFLLFIIHIRIHIYV